MITQHRAFRRLPSTAVLVMHLIPFEFRVPRVCNQGHKSGKCVSEGIRAINVHFQWGERQNTKPPHPLIHFLSWSDGEKIGHRFWVVAGWGLFLNPGFQVLCGRAFRNDTGRFNGAEQTISLANRVTSLSDKFAVQQLTALKPFQSTFCPWMVS